MGVSFGEAPILALTDLLTRKEASVGCLDLRILLAGLRKGMIDGREVLFNPLLGGLPIGDHCGEGRRCLPGPRTLKVGELAM